jgi:hypothetical protein
MKLDDALSGVTELGFDTPPFIYFVERHASYANLVRAVVQRVDSGTIFGYASIIHYIDRSANTAQTLWTRGARDILSQPAAA